MDRPGGLTAEQREALIAGRALRERGSRTSSAALALLDDLEQYARAVASLASGPVKAPER